MSVRRTTGGAEVLQAERTHGRIIRAASAWHTSAQPVLPIISGTPLPGGRCHGLGGSRGNAPKPDGAPPREPADAAGGVQRLR
eukprot:1089010-Prymnesium_polylepis.1